MSESVARVIINQKSLPWSSTGKSLWHEWRAIQREEGKDPDDVPVASFEKFVCERALKRVSDEEEEEEEIVDTTSMTYTDAGASFESMIGDDLAKANAEVLSSPAMSLEDELNMTSSQELLKKAEEEEDDLMSFARNISRKKKVRKIEDDDDKNIVSGQVMSESLIGNVLQDVMEYSKKPIHALHKLTSKSGQQMLKDQISSCCLKQAKMDASCPHFKDERIEGRTPLDAASNILSLLTHAERDDSISSNIAKESTQTFEEIRDMAYHMSTIPSSERTFSFPSSAVAASYEVKKLDKTPVHKINSIQLTAIEKNYLFSQSTAFGTWGVQIIQKRSTPRDLISTAQKLSKDMVQYLNDPKNGQKYDYPGTYVGYQATVGYLIGLLRHLHKNLPPGSPTRKNIANVSSEALDHVRQMIKDGSFHSDFFKFEARGMVSGKKKKGRKIKKLARKGATKGIGVLVDSTSKVLKTVVFNASEEYKKALNEEEQSSGARILPAEKKQQVVLENVLGPDDDTPGYVHAEAMKGAKSIGLRAFGKSKLADADLFLSYDRTILAIAATLGKLVTDRSIYFPISEDPVKNNILRFLVAAQRDVSGESGYTVQEITSNVLTDEEHDALVESMISIRDFISNDENARGSRRTGSSPEWEFVVVIPHKDHLKEDVKERTYENIHQYVFESKKKKKGEWTSLPDTMGTRLSGNYDNASKLSFSTARRHSLLVSDTFIPEGAKGKLNRWKERKNINIRVRRCVDIV